MVRHSRLLWDNPALRPDDAERLRRLEFDTDPDEPPERRKRHPASKPDPSPPPSDEKSRGPRRRKKSP